MNYIIVNLDRQEYITPENLGNNSALAEFAPAGDGVMFALGVLLAYNTKDIFVTSDGCDGKGLIFKYTEYTINDTRSPYRFIHKLFGSWAGDRIAIAGNETDNRFVPIAQQYNGKISEVPANVVNNLYTFALGHFNDISEDIKDAIMEAEESWASFSPNVHTCP